MIFAARRSTIPASMRSAKAGPVQAVANATGNTSAASSNSSAANSTAANATKPSPAPAPAPAPSPSPSPAPAPTPSPPTSPSPLSAAVAAVSDYDERSPRTFASPAPISLGYLPLLFDSNYRPDWSRLTHLAFTGAELDRTGRVTGTAAFTAIHASSVISDAVGHGVRPTLVIRSRMGATLHRSMLTTATRNFTAAQITKAAVDLLGSVTAPSVQLDLQSFRWSDKARFTALALAVRAALQSVHAGAELSVTLPPNAQESKKFQLAELARTVDFFVLSAHDLAGSGQHSAFATPVAPLYSVTGASVHELVAAYNASLPLSRLVLSLPWFGLQWDAESASGAPPQKGAAVVRGTASAVGAHAAASAALLAGAVYDRSAAAWWYAVPKPGAASNTSYLVGWAEDGHSFGAKLDYAAAAGLRGVAIASLGMDFSGQANASNDKLGMAGWNKLGAAMGSPATGNAHLLQCDLCLPTYDGVCPPQYQLSFYRFDTERDFNADNGYGPLPAGLTEAPLNPRKTLRPISWFPRLEVCCRRC